MQVLLSDPPILTLHNFDALFMHSLMLDLFIYCLWLFLLILMLHCVHIMFMFNIAPLNIINYQFYEQFEDLTPVVMNLAAYWDIAPCSPYVDRRYGTK
jgi:hypothetical protein